MYKSAVKHFIIYSTFFTNLLLGFLDQLADAVLANGAYIARFLDSTFLGRRFPRLSFLRGHLFARVRIHNYIIAATAI